MKRSGLVGLFLAAVLAAVPAAAFAAEEQSLLAADGTLHVVRSGRAVDLGVTDAANPDDIVIDWTSRHQDGTLTTALVPGTSSGANKRNLQIAFDEPTQTLLLLWSEDMFPSSQVRIGVYHGGVWTNSGLLPSHGISGAYNPTMMLSHQAVSHLDRNGKTVRGTGSVLSVIWWEDAQYGQARYAALFFDENGLDPTSMAVFDLPVLIGGGGDTPYGDIPSGSYLFPSIQADGLSGSIIASFVDIHANRHRVVKIQFPEYQGNPYNVADVDWRRRHTPIVGVMADGPIARMTPNVTAHVDRTQIVGTTIGSGYRPTLYWLDGGALKYSHLGASDWEPVRAVTIDESMTYDRALALVVGMGQRN